MKETVGKIATDLLQKADNKHTITDQMRENLSDFETNVLIAADRGLKEHNSDFFVVVNIKKEPLFENVYRNQFFHRKSCPTPTYDQIVYKYHYQPDALEFLWVVPDKETCMTYKMYTKIINKDEQQLMRFITEFFDGTLDRIAAKLNNEPINGEYLIDKHVVPIVNHKG